MERQDDDDIPEVARRISLCWCVLDGIPTSVLEKLASLPPAERFGALSDIAKLHEMKEGST